MLRPYMLVANLARRHALLLRSTRALSTEVKTRVVRDEAPGTFVTTSRESFQRAFPELAAKQDHHERMVKEFKLPVHRSGGPLNDVYNQLLYGFGAVLLLYTMYMYYLVIAKN